MVWKQLDKLKTLLSNSDETIDLTRNTVYTQDGAMKVSMTEG